MPESTSLDRTKEELARILNVDGIKTSNPRWLSLMREGVVVKLHVRRWRAKHRLSADALGLPRESDDLIGDLLELGDKRLLPVDLARKLEAIESAGRKALERSGYTTFWGTFVPATHFTDWQAENNAHKARYFAARDGIAERYDEIVAELAAAYRGAARAAFRRARALAGEEITREVLIDEALFVDRFLRRIRALRLAIKLDTNGSRPAVLRALFAERLLDYVAMDVKAPWTRYASLTGTPACDIAALRASVALIAGAGVAHQFRTTRVDPLLSGSDYAAIRLQIPAGSPHVWQAFRTDHCLDPVLCAAPDRERLANR